MIKLCEPNLENEEFEEIKKVLESGYLVQGEKVEMLEGIISDYLNIKHCIAVSSGTAALHLALIALGINPGDEVIVPDFTFPATANVVELVGAKSKFVDINLDNFCIDENKIQESITERTKAIIPVHEFGQSANMDEIVNIAKKYNLKIIEDAACALGTEYKGKKVGTIGDIGCFSLHPRKAITTGEGGIIATNNGELAEKIKVIRNHGISYLNGKIEFIAAGFNYRMTEMQAAIGIIQMKKIKNIIEYRKFISKRYEELLKDEDNLVLPKDDYGTHIYQTYHILLDNKFSRDLIKDKLKENGIESNLGAYAIHVQQYYKEKYESDDQALKNSLFAYKQGLALPIYHKISVGKIKYICEHIKAILK